MTADIPWKLSAKIVHHFVTETDEDVARTQCFDGCCERGLKPTDREAYDMGWAALKTYREGVDEEGKPVAAWMAHFRLGIAAHRRYFDGTKLPPEACGAFLCGWSGADMWVSAGMDARVEVPAFNDTVPVGSRVRVLRDDGSELRTTTRSEAWLLGGHTPVVMVDGIAGGYLLDRVTKEEP